MIPSQCVVKFYFSINLKTVNNKLFVIKKAIYPMDNQLIKDHFEQNYNWDD